MIELHGVTKRYGGGREALADLSFSLPRGSMTFLTGHSGAGKSTLLKLLLLLERPSRGQLVVGGVNLARMARRAIPRYRQQVGVVFQDHHLLPGRSVYANVELPLVIAGYTAGERGRRVRAALSRVGLLERERARPEQLSAGEQQRVGIARAVVNRPALLLADEPTGNLDPDLSREVMALFRSFHQVGVTVLVATHDLELVETFDAPALELSEGRLLGSGPDRQAEAAEAAEGDPEGDAGEEADGGTPA